MTNQFTVELLRTTVSSATSAVPAFEVSKIVRLSCLENLNKVNLHRHGPKHTPSVPSAGSTGAYCYGCACRSRAPFGFKSIYHREAHHSTTQHTDMHTRRRPFSPIAALQHVDVHDFQRIGGVPIVDEHAELEVVVGITPDTKK